MGDRYTLITKCILCGLKYNSKSGFKNIKDTIVHTSKKSIKDVLTHISKCIKGNVFLPESSFVCCPCYDKLAEYDNLMLQLLTRQRDLSKLLETTMNTVDLDDDEVSIKEESSIEASEGEDYIESLKSDCDSEAEPGDDEDAEHKPERNFGCGVCDETFSSKNKLDRHMQQHNTTVKCYICGEERRDEEYMELHMNVHEGKTENDCRYCDKRYSRRANVIRHMHIHWDKKKFQCEKCGLRFSQANILYNHRMHHDAEESPLICDQCDQTFKSKKTFNHHMLTHRKDRPMYPCELCGKKFTEKYTLKVHLKTHTGESVGPLRKREKKSTGQEFVCIICEAAFSAKDLLNVHMAQDHDVVGEIRIDF